MTKYIVELEGTIELDAPDELSAEDTAMEFINGDVSTIVEMDGHIDVNFTVLDVKEA